MLRSNRSLATLMALYTLLGSVTFQSVTVSAGAVQMGSSRALAESPPNSVPRSNSMVIKLLRAAALEDSPAKAVEILKQAREEIKKERFTREVADRLNARIEELEKIQQAKLERQKTPVGFVAGVPFSSGKSYQIRTDKLPTVIGLGNDESGDERKIEDALNANPEIRDTMWEIGRSRLSRDNDNLSAIVKERTGQTPEQIDSTEAQDKADLNKPSAFLQVLNNFDILKLDFSKANLQLKQEYEGVSLDILADQLIRDSAKVSAVVGALKGSTSQIGPKFRVLGVSSEVVASYLINAKLVLRIADLYGIQLDDSEKQIYLLAVWTAVRVSAQTGAKSQLATGLISSFSTKFAQLKFAGKISEFVKMASAFWSNPQVARIAAPALEGGALVTPAELASTSRAPAPFEQPGLKPAPSNAAVAEAPKKFAAIRSIASRINLMGFAMAGASAVFSAGETMIAGNLAKVFCRQARQEKRAIHNENFRRFLMTPTGEGFIKLLVLAMNDGRPSQEHEPNSRSQADLKAKMNFIINIARSARVCSEEDLKGLKDFKPNGAPPAVISYACKLNSNTARFERIKSEFQTFDSIPQDYVADLRVVSRENRLRMGDLILQMQFLDGDRSPDEVQFFRSIVAKALGIDNKSDLDYYERLHAFIQENGGLVLSSETPTGVTIGSIATARPYNMNRGYSPLNAPEAPPEFIDVAPATTKSSTTTPVPGKKVNE